MSSERIVLDSNVLIWLFYDWDSLHTEAKALVTLHKDSTFIVTYPVVQEVSSIFTYRFWKKEADRFIEFLKTTHNIILINNDIYEDIDLFLWVDLKISFTDVSLIWAAIKYNADLATFDKQLLKLYNTLINK